jgi:arylformamidase
VQSAIHDISVLLGPETVPWPGMSPVASRSVFADVARGDEVTGSSWTLNSHAGTHVDAPLHLFPDGDDIAKTTLERFVGRCVVVDLPHVVGRDIDRDDLEQLDELEGHTRVLLKTSNSRRLWDLDEFDASYVALAASGAELLVERGVRLVGIDYQGIERFVSDGHPTHKTLLHGDCAIVEGADLREISPGEYFLVCVPLRLQEGEASPARALLIELDAIAQLAAPPDR